MLALLEAFLGYSLVDDLMSGMGLVIGYSVGLSIPFVGQNLMNWLFDGMFPGGPQLWPRMYIAHVLIFPILIGLLLGAHLLLVAMRHHTQFRQQPGADRAHDRRRARVAGAGAALARAAGRDGRRPLPARRARPDQPDLALGAVPHVLLDERRPAGLVPRLADRRAAARCPASTSSIGHYTLVPNPFWGGAAFPLVVFGFLYLWPWLERRFSGDDAFHNLLDRPRDAPVRTGDRRGDGQLGLPRLPRRSVRSGRRHLRDRLRAADLVLPRRRLGAAGRSSASSRGGSARSCRRARSCSGTATPRRRRRGWRGMQRTEPYEAPVAGTARGSRDFWTSV